MFCTLNNFLVIQAKHFESNTVSVYASMHLKCTESTREHPFKPQTEKCDRASWATAAGAKTR